MGKSPQCSPAASWGGGKSSRRGILFSFGVLFSMHCGIPVSPFPPSPPCSEAGAPRSPERRKGCGTRQRLPAPRGPAPAASEVGFHTSSASSRTQRASSRPAALCPALTRRLTRQCLLRAESCPAANPGVGQKPYPCRRGKPYVQQQRPVPG